MFFPTTTSVSTLLRVLALASSASIPFAAAQTNPIIDELNGKISPTPPPPGYNVEGTSVFTNFARAYDEKQFFLVNTASATLYQKPATEPVQGTLLSWCNDLIFSDFTNSSLVGYAGNCVAMLLAYSTYFSGAQIPVPYVNREFTTAIGISAVFVEHLNIFEGQFHDTIDDDDYRYWDSGLKTMPTIGWEGYDAGDMHPNAATSSFSLFGELTWLSTEEAAQLLNVSVDEFTPEKFKKVYSDVWIKEQEALAKTAEAELEIIEEVKNETMPANEPATSVQPGETVASSGETAAPAELGTDEDVGTGPNLIEDDSAGNGRKLASVAARFASAALRVFGI